MKEDPIDKAVAELLQAVEAVPGLEVEIDPQDAALAGAFVEDALSYEDAAEGAIDQPHNAV